MPFLTVQGPNPVYAQRGGLPIKQCIHLILYVSKGAFIQTISLRHPELAGRYACPERKFSGHSSLSRRRFPPGTPRAVGSLPGILRFRPRTYGSESQCLLSFSITRSIQTRLGTGRWLWNRTPRKSDDNPGCSGSDDKRIAIGGCRSREKS